MAGIAMDINELKPTEQHRVMDLLAEAGMDVSDWAKDFAGDTPAANPKYCYNWSFRDDSIKLIVLNVWFTNMEINDGVVFQTLNLQKFANEEKDAARRRRAIEMDSAINWAYLNRWPLRVIICDQNPTVTSQRANRRLLDSVAWGVSERASDGTAIIVRGYQYPRYIDQFSIEQFPEEPVAKREVTSVAFERSSEMRSLVLSRAAGRCEYCGEIGFVTANGDVYLESHHIKPLSEGGVDRPENMAALCPNHHREAHFGANAAQIKKVLLAKLRS